MKPSDIVFSLGIITYILFAILIMLGVNNEAIKSVANAFNLVTLLSFTWISVQLVILRLDHLIMMYWGYLKEDLIKKLRKKK